MVVKGVSGEVMKVCEAVGVSAATVNGFVVRKGS